MNSLVEGVKVIQELVPASRSSAASGDWICMKNYDRVTFIFETGALSTGGHVLIQEAKNASGGSVATLDAEYFYEKTASTDTYTKTSMNSSTSVAGITIASTDDSKIFMVEVKADMLSDSFDWVNIKTPAAFSTDICGCVAIAHQSRYAEDNSPTALV